MQIALIPAAPDISALQEYYFQTPALTAAIDEFMSATVACRQAFNALDACYDRQERAFGDMCSAYEAAVGDRGGVA
jgi:hypothetical protein